jgi:hypothetical protein
MKAHAGGASLWMRSAAARVAGASAAVAALWLAVAWALTANAP